MIRTIDEIKKKFDEGFKHDFFGFGKEDILGALPFNEAKQHLKEGFVSLPTAEQEWEEISFKTKADVLNEMKDYLPFAFDKAHNGRGLSADRSIQHFIALSWLIDDGFYNELTNLYNTSYSNYGLPILRRIEEWVNEQEVTV